MIMDYDNDNDDYGCQNENLKLPPIGSTAPAPASPCISRSLFNNDDEKGVAYDGDDYIEDKMMILRIR